MATILAKLLDWLTGRSRADARAWRVVLETPINSKVPATVSSPTPALAEVALPQGSRIRQDTGGYSMTMGQLQEMNRLLKKIRPLPQGAIKVMQELDAVNASASTVAEAIECEPVMAASMVRLANSTAMGLRREITSVSEAVAYLGFSTTKSLLLRFNMDSCLPSSKPGLGYDSGKLWVHAMAVAQVAEEIARRAGRTDPKLALTAGLLHDIGKLAINSQPKDTLAELWSPKNDPNEGLLNRERRLFKADHAIIGSTLAADWKLPQDLTDIIRLHHTPSGHQELQPEPRRALLSVHIANQLVKYRHVYCEAMEIDEIPATITSELNLPDYATLLNDRALRSIIDRVILLNSGGSQPTAAAA